MRTRACFICDCLVCGVVGFFVGTAFASFFLYVIGVL